jgi:hypothetical protein
MCVREGCVVRMVVAQCMVSGPQHHCVQWCCWAKVAAATPNSLFACPCQGCLLCPPPLFPVAAGSAEHEYELMLTSLLERVVLTSHHPRTQILVVVQVWGGGVLRGGTVVAYSSVKGPARCI